MELLLKFVIHYQAHIFLNHSLNDASHSSTNRSIIILTCNKKKSGYLQRKVLKKKIKPNLEIPATIAIKYFLITLRQGGGGRRRKKSVDGVENKRQAGFA